MKKLLALAVSALVFQQGLLAQDLDSLMNAATTQETKTYATSAFKSTRVISFPSLENVRKNVLDFRIAHRFGDINTGANNAFGLDGPASIRLGLDYGINDWLMIGIGRSSADKMIDGSVKLRMLRQTEGNKTPISITLFEAMNYTTMKDPNAAVTGFDKYGYALNRLSYSSTLIIGRKFSGRFSFQLQGFWVHYNIVDKISDKNDMFAAGFAGRAKITQRVAITWEYAYRINKYSDSYSSFFDPLGIGVDIETGGHVFQMHFTNAFAMNEAQYIPYTSSDFFKGGIKLGFNITRAFAVGGKKSGGSGNGW